MRWLFSRQLTRFDGFVAVPAATILMMDLGRLYGVCALVALFMVGNWFEWLLDELDD